MQDLLPIAASIGTMLKERGQSIAVAESSAGGLISAALLALPGASAYFIGGVVVYTKAARGEMLGITEADMAGLRPSTEAYALLLARRARARFGTVWAISETGAAGPAGNRYGDRSGHCCVAISGPTEKAVTIETGDEDRVANMRAFAAGALDLLAGTLGS